MKRYGFLVSCIILVCGLIWSNLSLAVDIIVPKCPPRKNCIESFVFSKDAFSEAPLCFERFDCLTEGIKNCDDCIMRMKWKAEINSSGSFCDEAVIIPDGSILDVDLTYHIRQIGPCGTLVGTHEGKFKIYDEDGKLLATGKMKGTNGLTHFLPPCCDPTVDDGLMEGTIFRSPTGRGRCKLIATYESFIFGTGDVCSKDFWKNWTLHIDGIIQCGCPLTRSE